METLLVYVLSVAGNGTDFCVPPSEMSGLQHFLMQPNSSIDHEPLIFLILAMNLVVVHFVNLSCETPVLPLATTRCVAIFTMSVAILRNLYPLCEIDA